MLMPRSRKAFLIVRHSNVPSMTQVLELQMGLSCLGHQKIILRCILALSEVNISLWTFRRRH
jgi:hypothetical protein